MGGFELRRDAEQIEVFGDDLEDKALLSILLKMSFQTASRGDVIVVLQPRVSLQFF